MINSVRSTASSNYGLLIGGGTSGRTLSRLFREHLPEMSEYNDVKTIHSAMKAGAFTRTAVLFGDGNTRKCLNDHRPFMSLLARLAQQVNTTDVEPLDDCQGAATLENFQASMESLTKEIKPGDRLWLYLSSHGLMFRGISLWNQYITKDFLGPRHIDEQLAKLPKGVTTTIIIDSCYSGIFHSLSAKATVLTTADRKNPSYYTAVHGSEVTKKLAHFFMGQENLLTSFSDGCQVAHNFKAMDSLSHYLNKHFAPPYLHSINRIYDDNIRATLHKLPPFATTALSSFILAFIIARDTTGTLELLWDGKMGLIFGKASLPFVKGILCAMAPSMVTGVQNKFSKMSLYKKWHTLPDQLALKFASLKVKDDTVLPPHLQVEVDTLLTSLKTLKEKRLQDERLTPYSLLLDKVELFIKSASQEEIETMLKFSKHLLETFQK